MHREREAKKDRLMSRVYGIGTLLVGALLLTASAGYSQENIASDREAGYLVFPRVVSDPLRCIR